jgi:hypothetical protein
MSIHVRSLSSFVKVGVDEVVEHEDMATSTETRAREFNEGRIRFRIISVGTLLSL